MISHVKDLSPTLYLTFTNEYIGALLAQEGEEIEHPVYYLSRSLRGAEVICLFPGRASLPRTYIY